MHKHCFQPGPHPDYDRCHFCGTCVNRVPIDHQAVYGGDYWNQPGRSTLAEQAFNVDGYESSEGLTKIDAVLIHVQRGSTALEIACAPGVMLHALGQRFDWVFGIEYDASYKAEIEKHASLQYGQCELTFGSFPSCTSGWSENYFDCIIGMDILEHADDGAAFMSEVHRLLKPGGVAVMMLPIFGLAPDSVRPCDYNIEHRWLYSKAYLQEWLGEMFASVEFDYWTAGHGIVIARK